MLVNIKDIKGRMIHIEISESSSIMDLKNVIFKSIGIYPQFIKIIWGGMEMTNEVILQDYYIQSNSTLYMVLRYQAG